MPKKIIPGTNIQIDDEDELEAGAAVLPRGAGLGGLAGLEEDAPVAAPVSPERRLHELNQNAKATLSVVREALTMLKKKYKPGDMLDDLENFEGYYRTMKDLFDQIVVGLKEKDAFTIEHRTGELQMKLHQLTRKLIILEEEKPAKKQHKELLDHFRMLQTDTPSNRKTLSAWVKGRVVDPANPEQTKADLIHALECYIKIRSSEKKWFGGYNKQDKLDAAQAMIDFLRGGQNVSITLDQLEAVTSDDLGKIISKFQSVVPDVDFNPLTNRWVLEEKIHPTITVGADDGLEEDAAYTPPTLR